MLATRLGPLAAGLIAGCGLLGCSLARPVPPVTAAEAGWIESRTFVVPAPGEGWGLEVNRPEDRIAFVTGCTAPDEREVWSFRIEAAAGRLVAGDAPLPPEEELAAAVLADEVRRAGEGAKPERGLQTIAGKRLHFVHWEASRSIPRGFMPMPGDRRVTVYVYFPPEQGGRASYLFRVTETRERHNIYAPPFDHTRAYPVIAGFRPK
jgi:hypothetical protein